MLSRFCENGEHYYVHTWSNSCGHIDRYAAVLVKADLYKGDEVVTNRYAGGWLGCAQRDT